MTLKEFGSFCEIQDGALAGEEDIQYKFLFENGDSLTYGNGKRIIELREKNNLSLGIGGYIPIFKSCDPSTEFECYDTRNNKFLGVIGAEYKCQINGFLSRPDLKEKIYAIAVKQIHEKLIAKEKYIDELAHEKNVVSSNFWDAHQTFTLSLEKAGETIAPIQKINLKKGVIRSIDSLPFSTYLGDSLQYSHEILIADREKKQIVLKRYANNGTLVIEAVFVSYRGDDNDPFKQIEEGYRRTGGITLFKYRRASTDDFISIWK
jgi:hypothetical protein